MNKGLRIFTDLAVLLGLVSLSIYSGMELEKDLQSRALAKEYNPQPIYQDVNGDGLVDKVYLRE